MTNGIVAFLASGYNVAQISGQTVSIAGSISTTAGVSGQTVYLVNDGINNVIQASGQTVYLVNNSINNVVAISGQTVALISGAVQLISGGTTQVIIRSTGGGAVAVGTASVDNVSTLGNALQVFNQSYGYLRTSNVWARMEVTAMQSGDGYRLMVATSGQVQYELGNNPRTQGGVVITAASGGTLLPNISGFSLLLRNVSGNGTMMIGSVNNSPDVIGISGIGMPLYAGDSLTLKVNNANQVRVLAGVSGNVLALYMMDR